MASPLPSRVISTATSPPASPTKTTRDGGASVDADDIEVIDVMLVILVLLFSIDGITIARGCERSRLSTIIVAL